MRELRKDGRSPPPFHLLYLLLLYTEKNVRQSRTENEARRFARLPANADEGWVRETLTKIFVYWFDWNAGLVAKSTLFYSCKSSQGRRVRILHKLISSVTPCFIVLTFFIPDALEGTVSFADTVLVKRSFAHLSRMANILLCIQLQIYTPIFCPGHCNRFARVCILNGHRALKSRAFTHQIGIKFVYGKYH